MLKKRGVIISSHIVWLLVAVAVLVLGVTIIYLVSSGTLSSLIDYIPELLRFGGQ